MSKPIHPSTQTRGFRLVLPTLGEEKRFLRIEAPRDYHVPRELQFHGLSGYESETLGCFLATLEEANAGPFFDVGANVGLFSWLVGAISDREAHAFEPTPELATCLELVAVKNRLSISVHKLALSDCTGEAEFFLSSRSDCSNSLNPDFRESTKTLRVPLETLDSFSEQHGLVPAIIKIDTETTEPAVLRGALQTIETHRPWILCEVLPGATEKELSAALLPLGYSWYQITDEIPLQRRDSIVGDSSGKYTNWLFAPSPPSEEFWNRMLRWKSAVRACLPHASRALLPSRILSFGTSEEEFRTCWGHNSTVLEAQWADEGVTLTLSPDAGSHVYFFHGDTGFDKANSAESLPVDPTQLYEIVLEVEGHLEEIPSMHLLVLEFDDEKQINQGRVYLRPGTNIHRFMPQAEAKMIRIAYRATSPGRLTISDPAVFTVTDAG